MSGAGSQTTFRITSSHMQHAGLGSSRYFLDHDLHVNIEAKVDIKTLF